MKPLVTVIIVTYNHEAYIGECLQGVLAQSYQNLQILVLDDASTDATQTVVSAYSDPRITYIRREKNLGLVANYNAGLSLVRGEFLWGMGGDDFFCDRNAVASTVSVFKEHPGVGFAFSQPESNSATHRTLFSWGEMPRIMSGSEVAQALTRENRICGPTVAARTDLCRQFGRYPEGFDYVGDWFAWYLYALNSKEVFYNPVRMVHYRFHGSNLTTQFSGRRAIDRLVQETHVRLAMLHMGGLTPELRSYLGGEVRSALLGLLERWMNKPNERGQIISALDRDWQTDGRLDGGLDAAKHVRSLLHKANFELVGRALRERRPVFLLRALHLFASTRGFRFAGK